MEQREILSLTASDGHPLSATVTRPDGTPRAQLIVGGATGVPQAFYRRFALFAAERGYQTWTVDFRGIGQSAPPTLRGFRMNYLDWARLDLAALVDRAAQEDGPRFLVGHSFGGHAFGLLPNAEEIQACYTFATGAGWRGWMPWHEQIKVWFLWNVVGPLLIRWKGCLAWKQLGMGENLPSDVFIQWRHWCRFPHYFFDDPQQQGMIKQAFQRVRVPMIAANAIDDLWATPSSRNAFMQGYVNADWRGIDLVPGEIGLRTIGHMGYFRKEAFPLWEQMLDWFESLASTSVVASESCSKA